MQGLIYLLPLLVAFAPTFATRTRATRALEARQASQCGEQSTLSTGTFTLSSDEWGASYGTGSQCSSINGLDGSSISWATTWSWENNINQVKSYTHVTSSTTYCTQISSISSIPTTWSWSYSGNSLRCNVAYDTFLGSSCSGAPEYEVMIWPGKFGGNVYPLSNNGYPPTPSATTTIGSSAFNLIIGTEGDTTVYSFVAVGNATDFSGDIHDFYKFLVQNEGLSASLYVLSINAGTEVLTGSNADFTTNSFTLSQS